MGKQYLMITMHSIIHRLPYSDRTFWCLTFVIEHPDKK